MENRLETNIYSGGAQLMTKIKEEGNLDQLNRQMNLDNIFIKDPLAEIANLLKQQGIKGHNSKIALLSILNILSAKLNKSMCLMLASSDPYVAMSILRQSMKMAPEHAYRECGQFKHEELFGDDSDLNGKTLIGLEPSAFTKTWMHLEKMLTMGSTTHVEIVKSKYNTFAHSHRAESLVSVIGVIPDLKDKTYNHPVVLKLPVEVDEYPLSHFSVLQDNHPQDVYAEVAMARIRETLARLQPMTVDIPYADVLLNAIKETNTSDPERKMEMILKTLAICCIINNPSPVNKDEIIARLYNIDVEKLRLIEAKSSSAANQNQPAAPKALMATKVDYFYVWLLLNEMLPVKQISLSERQAKVFKTVKQLNLDKLKNSFAGDNTVKQLSLIAASSAYWVKRENIFEALNHSGKEEISQSTIYNELQHLIKEGFIAEGKYPKSTQRGFHVTTFDAGKKILLPHPSTIIDNTFKGEKVTVTNPLTGEVETI
ncbi:MAG: hypothetical protein QUS13_03375 [Smithella sp.]|nr:hypothetical protein [Smithella sp.]